MNLATLKGVVQLLHDKNWPLRKYIMNSENRSIQEKGLENVTY